jgi:predicted GNAT family acetyltransferase
LAKEGQVVAFARTTSDGAFTATVWDVCVAPAWQRSGIGVGIMERMIDRLLDEEITNVNLYAESKVVEMYRQKLGFRESPNDTRAMSFRFDSRPYSNQKYS